jgi:hypothetical protein
MVIAKSAKTKSRNTIIQLVGLSPIIVELKKVIVNEETSCGFRVVS